MNANNIQISPRLGSSLASAGADTSKSALRKGPGDIFLPSS